MLQPNDIQILETLLKQTNTDKPFFEVSSKFRRLTGRHYTPEQIAEALKQPVSEQTSLF